MIKDLREFIKRAEELGKIKIIEGANWDLEIGAICRSLAGSEDPPALMKR